MRRAPIVWTRLFCTLLLAACTSVAPLPPPDYGPRTQTVRVVSNGWHTSIVVERAQLAEVGLMPEAADFPDAAFLEFGWGDRIYYPAKEKTLPMTLDAVFIATPAVMHMAGLAQRPELTYADVEVVPVALSKDGLGRLMQTIAGQFERPDGDTAKRVSRGLYPNSNFYNARGKFHLFNTCNTWTARMLRASGIDLSPSGIVTADELVTRLRALIDTKRQSGA